MHHAGWRSRGYLPYCDQAGLLQHIVISLADALPNAAPADMTDATARAAWADRELDAHHGARLLAQARHAREVQRCLLHEDGQRYALVAWCVMPTHVHVVAEQFPGHRLSDVVQSWKSVTAHAIVKAEGTKGTVWRREYFDRFMRSEAHLAATVAYVEDNPVKAGLVERPGDWLFSSAAGR